MPYILTAFFNIQHISADDARAMFYSLRSSAAVDLTASRIEVRKFIQTLMDQYPPFDKFHPDTSCPWDSPFAIYADGAIVALDVTYSHELAPWVKSAARHHDLTCYDPQSHTVEMPSALYGLPITHLMLPAAEAKIVDQQSVTAKPKTTIALIPGTTYYDPPSFQVSSGSHLFYDESPTGRNYRREVLLKIIESSGPLRMDVVLQAMAETFNIPVGDTRSTQLLHDAAVKAAASGDIEIRGAFVYLKGQSSYPARISRSQPPVRIVDEISTEEIGEVLMAILRLSGDIDRDELVQKSLYLFGYGASGENDRERIAAAMAGLELDNRIDVMGGHVRALEPV